MEELWKIDGILNGARESWTIVGSEREAYDAWYDVAGDSDDLIAIDPIG